MVDLTHIELATDKDRAYGIDRWARLFKSTTWEEIRMIAEKQTLTAENQSMAAEIELLRARLAAYKSEAAVK